MSVVITGDIISSSKLALARRQQLLNELFDKLFLALRSVWRDRSHLRTETIQGDSFQVYLLDNKEALRAAFLIKCFCLAQDKMEGNYRLDCRLSIAIGDVTLLHSESLAKSGGLVFDYSGRGLKEISRTGPQLVFESTEVAWNQTINMGLTLAGALVRHNTSAQSQATFLKLAHPEQTQDWLAEQAGIGRSAYSQRLKQADWTAINSLLDYYAKTVRLYFL